MLAFFRFGRLGVLPIVAVAMVLASQRVAAQPPGKTTAATKQGWTVNCANSGKGLQCKAVQTLLLRKSRQLLLSVTVLKPDGGNTHSMLIHLPHGLFLPAGVAVQVDSQAAHKLTIQTCDVKGCYAGLPISPKQLSMMAKGKRLIISFQNIKKQKVAVPLPLSGFAEAIRKL